jgi:hypothetical protein
MAEAKLVPSAPGDIIGLAIIRQQKPKPSAHEPPAPALFRNLLSSFLSFKKDPRIFCRRNVLPLICESKMAESAGSPGAHQEFSDFNIRDFRKFSISILNR